MSGPSREAAEAQARSRFIILNAVRFGGLALLMFGIASTRNILPFQLPWAVGVVLAVAGLLAFYFLPRFIARRWKATGGAAR